ncbi:MAG: PadR family transcriptional regulator [Proteobacteria bacterium]|nr:PadR family transcriptional regulator [Pseudomonadota bacterium]
MDVKTVCLGVLTLGNATGYEIHKMFEYGPFHYFTDAGFGSIYPALKRLRNDGLVDCTELAQEKRPDKKIYSITAEGRQALADALAEPPGDDKFRSNLLFSLFFAHLLPPGLAADAVKERIAWYREQLLLLQSCDRSGWGPGPVFVNGFGQAVYGAALEYLENNHQTLFDSPRANRTEVA